MPEGFSTFKHAPDNCAVNIRDVNWLPIFKILVYFLASLEQRKRNSSSSLVLFMSSSFHVNIFVLSLAALLENVNSISLFNSLKADLINTCSKPTRAGNWRIKSFSDTACLLIQAIRNLWDEKFIHAEVKEHFEPWKSLIRLFVVFHKIWTQKIIFYLFLKLFTRFLFLPDQNEKVKVFICIVQVTSR